MEEKRSNWNSWFFMALYAAVLYVALSHLDDVMGAVEYVLWVCSPVIYGLAIAYVANILVRFLEDKPLKRLSHKPQLRRTLSIILTIAIGAALLALISSVVIPTLLDAVRMADESLQSGQLSIPERLESILRRFSGSDEQADKWLQQVREGLDGVMQLLRTQSTQLARVALDVTGSVLGGTFSALLSLIVAVYALYSREWLSSASRKVTVALLPERACKETLSMAARLNRAFQGFIRSQIIEGIILGGLCYVGMRIFGMPYPSVVSVVIGVTSLVPVAGSWAGALMGALLILTESPVMALWFLVFLFTLQQLEDNLIYPRVVGDSVGLPSLLVLCAIFVGGNISGIAGMLYAVPLTAALWDRLMEKLYPNRAKKQKREPKRRLRTWAKRSANQIDQRAEHTHHKAQ